MKKMSVWLKKVSVMFSLVMILCVCAPVLAFGLTWETLSPMQRARGYLAVVAADGLLYGLGGNSGNLENYVEAYNPATKSWDYKATLLNNLCSAAAGVIDHKIYIAGGLGQDYTLNKLQIYDISSNSWSYGTDMPVPSKNSTSGVINGILYVQISDSTSFYAYDPATNTWVQKTDAPEVHNSAGVGVIDGKLYVAGGNNNHLDVYDPTSNTWTSKASMSTYRNAMAGGVWNGRLYVAGGVDGTGPVSSVEVYDPITDTWAPDTAMLTARYGLGGAFIDGTFYALGGNDGTKYISTLEAGAVPLPASVLLLGTGLAGLGALGRRRRKYCRVKGEHP